MTFSIPASPHDLTPAWVTAAMRSAGVLPRGRVRSLEVRPLTGGGIGFTGDTVRVRLEYDDAPDAPRSVVAKFPTADQQMRGMLESFDAYAREIRFYRDLAHRMPCPTPTYLGADFDDNRRRVLGPRASRLVDRLPDVVQLALTKDVTKFMRVTKRRYALLIEDMGEGTVVFDANDPPDDAGIGRALDVLADVHASFWRDDSLRGNGAFGPLITTTPGLYQTVGRKRCLDLAKARWTDWLTESQASALEQAIDDFADNVELVNEPITLVHGDARSDNLLFREDDDAVVLLDWSLSGFAHPGFDVGYLLSSCLDSDRLASRPALVDRYEQALVERGVALSPGSLRAAIKATYGAIAVQQLMSVAVMRGENYGDHTLYDIWMPRLLDGLLAPLPEPSSA